jgi:Sulfotransferase domain
MKASDVIAEPANHDILRAAADPKNPFPLRAFFGHHKCASGWIDNILREFCLHMGLKFKIVHQPYSFEKYGTLGKLVDAEKIQFLAYINTTTTYTPDLKVYRGFHVVRDPRDIVVSAYFSHLKSLNAPTWDELNVLRDKLSGLNKEDGLFFELEYLGQQFKEMSEWNYNQEHILEVRMEDLSAEPFNVFRKILEFLEMFDHEERTGLAKSLHALRLSMNRLNHKGRRHMPGNLPMFPVPKRPVYTLPQEALESIADRLSFAKLAGGRTKGEENVNSHYRKGVHGDWKNHFTPEHTAYFKAHYNDLLVQLGYEEGDDW